MSKTQEALRVERALKLALEALNMTDSECGSRAWEREHEAICAISEALAAVAEPHEQQEPVAWAWRNTKTDGRGIYWENPAQFYDLSKPSDYEWTPLYTSPLASASQRSVKPWRGLTDKDLAGCDDEEFKQARYWEQVLREKNT